MDRNGFGLLSSFGVYLAVMAVAACIAAPATADQISYDCSGKAAAYAYTLGKPGDQETISNYMKDCMEASKPPAGLSLSSLASLRECTDAEAASCSSCWNTPGNTWCCTKKNNATNGFDCGADSNSTCNWTPCSGGCAGACRKPSKNSGGATNIKIINQTDSNVDIAFITGAVGKQGELGACKDGNKIISYKWVAQNTDWCTDPKAAGEANAGWCTGTVGAGKSVELKRTGDDAQKCLSGAIMLGGKQSCPGKCPVGMDNCREDQKTGPNGFTQAEFTFNPTDTSTEGVNISLVNGVNYAMSINLPGNAWTLQDSADIIKVIGPNVGIAGNNNLAGIYPPGCTDCIKLKDNLPCPDVPPNFSNDKCQKKRQCHAQRGGMTGGTVEFVIEKKLP